MASGLTVEQFHLVLVTTIDHQGTGESRWWGSASVATEDVATVSYEWRGGLPLITHHLCGLEWRCGVLQWFL